MITRRFVKKLCARPYFVSCVGLSGVVGSQIVGRSCAMLVGIFDHVSVVAKQDNVLDAQ